MNDVKGAETLSEVRAVFVLGAGFTRAFVPAAPLITDDYGGADLVKKFKHFYHASRVLDLELSRGNGRINIERLMTRLDGRMPYDFDQGANEELGMLLTELKKNFTRRIQMARTELVYTNELAAFARYCVDNHITCITFNYDDVFDEALWNVRKVYNAESAEPYWHPDGGYGFFCRPSQVTVEDTPVQMDLETSMLLLKLHGSINWHTRRGYPRPYVVDAIMHHESWFLESEPREAARQAVSLHMELEPFIVPPILFKSALVEQPVLRLIWHLAYSALSRATSVAFVGYSFPPTDIAASVLFDEALETLPRTDIRAVNLARSKSGKQRVRDAYQAILGSLADEQFDFRGALDWARDLVSGKTQI